MARQQTSEDDDDEADDLRPGPFYVFLIRIYCELLIVIFRMNDTLTDIKNAVERQPR